MPALLLAALSLKSTQYFKRAFPRVVDNGRMLRTLVQILRSGAVGRKSLGSVPKVLVQIAVKDSMLNDVLMAIETTAKTGKIGDGKVFITPIDEAIRIRTGERGEDAI